jgi:hypothetical protein
VRAKRFGHDGTRPTRTGEPGNGRQHVHTEDGQITHRTHRSKIAKSSETFVN